MPVETSHWLFSHQKVTTEAKRSLTPPQGWISLGR
jgi:hypothetical protein